MRKNNIMKLTAEQRKLVEDNHKLIYGYMAKYRLNQEQWYSICAIGLCKAAYAYDGSCSFSTFAYKCMFNEVSHEMRDNKKTYRIDNRTISLYSTFKTSINEEAPIEEIIASEAKNEDYAVDMEWARWFLEHASTIMLKIIYSKLSKCKTCQQVADDAGVSREAINKQMRSLQKYYKEGKRPYCRVRYDSLEERKKWKEKIFNLLDKMQSV